MGALVAVVMVIVQLALIPTLWLTTPSVPETVASVDELKDARARLVSSPFYSLFVETHRQESLESTSVMSRRFAALTGRNVRTYSVAPTMLGAYGDLSAARFRLTGAIILALVALLGLGTGRAPKNGFAALVLSLVVAGGAGAPAYLFLLPTVAAAIALLVHSRALTYSTHADRSRSPRTPARSCT